MNKLAPSRPLLRPAHHNDRRRAACDRCGRFTLGSDLCARCDAKGGTSKIDEMHERFLRLCEEVA
jgi:hypothetical protein